MTAPDDALLIDAALAGDTSAFGELVRRYQDRLFTTLCHLSGCHEEAQDVAQEAFVQALVKLETFQRSAGFYTWLYRIAFNLFVSRQRKRRPNVSIEQVRETSGLEPLDEGPAPDGRLQQRELQQQVRRGLAALSEEHRTVLVLREMEGLDYERISELMDIPIGTVRSRLHRARLQLRDELRAVMPNERQN